MEKIVQFERDISRQIEVNGYISATTGLEMLEHIKHLSRRPKTAAIHPDTIPLFEEDDHASGF